MLAPPDQPHERSNPYVRCQVWRGGLVSSFVSSLDLLIRVDGFSGGASSSFGTLAFLFPMALTVARGGAITSCFTQASEPR